MTAWFGPSWQASACDPAQHRVTPVGTPCSEAIGGCGRRIVNGDQGIILPGDLAPHVVHIDCWLRIIGGPCRTHGVIGCRGDGTTTAAGPDSIVRPDQTAGRTDGAGQ